jgi:leucyl-tRNA synthetase
LFEAAGLTEPDPAAGDDRPRKYVVGMYAYPSGDLHGACRDVLDRGRDHRFERIRGFNVLGPVGWDSFGLPAENAARRRNLDPRAWTYANIAVQARRSAGWVFLRLADPPAHIRSGVLPVEPVAVPAAVRARFGLPGNRTGELVPHRQTVLANEQVIDGRCERCGDEVVERRLTQWFFRITAYADRLLDDMAQLGGWPQDILTMRATGSAVPCEDAGRLPTSRWLISRQRTGTRSRSCTVRTAGWCRCPRQLPIRLPS